jgi:hypothetical protein
MQPIFVNMKLILFLPNEVHSIFSTAFAKFVTQKNPITNVKNAVLSK